MLNIKYGHDSALLKGIEFKTGEALEDGIWVVYDAATGKLVKQTGAYNPATQGYAMPVYGGNTVRFDSKHMGAVTVATGKNFFAETDQVQATTIAIGDPLTLLDGKLTKAVLTGDGAVSPAAIVGYAQKPNTAGTVEFTRA